MAKVCRWNACNQTFGQLEDLIKHVDTHIEQAQPRSVDQVSQPAKRKLSEAMISTEAKDRWKRSNISTDQIPVSHIEVEDIASKIRQETEAPVSSIPLNQEPAKPLIAAAEVCHKCQNNIADSLIECDICHLNWHAACYPPLSPNKAFLCANCSQIIAAKS